MSRLPALAVEGAPLERFEHAGLIVELQLATGELGPRHEDLGHDGGIVFAAPYEALSDRRDRKRLLADDGALSALLAEPLKAGGLRALSEHLRLVHGARVVVPIYLDEQAETRTRVDVLTESSVACPMPRGVIFDTPRDESARADSDGEPRSEVAVREALMLAIEDYALYMRGN